MCATMQQSDGDTGRIPAYHRGPPARDRGALMHYSVALEVTGDVVEARVVGYPAGATYGERLRLFQQSY